MALDIASIKKAADVAVKSVDTGNMHEAKSTERSLPASGRALARLVGVIEIGEHEVTGGPNIAPKIKDRIRYVFELFGKKYPNYKLDDGTEIPQRVSRSITNSRHEKSTQYAWVSAMDPEKKYSHPIQMIGDSFIVVIEHKVVPDGSTIAYIKSVEQAQKEDLDTGEITPIEAPEPLSDYMIFMWENPSLEMWNSLYIPGEFDGRSRNIFQNMISEAVNFEGSPAAAMLAKAIEDGENVTGVNDDEADQPADGSATPQEPATTGNSAQAVDDLDDVDAGVDVPKKKPAPKPEPVGGSQGENTSSNSPLQGKAAERLASLMGTT